jgi:hypothetical protein
MTRGAALWTLLALFTGRVAGQLFHLVLASFALIVADHHRRSVATLKGSLYVP